MTQDLVVSNLNLDLHKISTHPKGRIKAKDLFLNNRTSKPNKPFNRNKISNPNRASSLSLSRLSNPNKPSIPALKLFPRTTNNLGQPCFPTIGCRPPGENPNDRESPRCPNASPNQIHSFDGKRVIYTWEIAGNCEKFTAIQADNYCKAQGGRAASLDTPERAKFFMDKLLGRRYMWTGGRIVHQCKTVFWPSGKTTQWTNTGVAPWSYTGGWEIAPNCTRGQPDNRNALRDQSDPEVCLGVLNNFYVDGIVWHDVACHHKKPTICELP
eukprot:TCALIF_06130-PA protein Name:"Protein of unknown function" AED:0.20 eAED:0.21 QI:0/0/0/0.5/1/1/4/0/268